MVTAMDGEVDLLPLPLKRKVISEVLYLPAGLMLKNQLVWPGRGAYTLDTEANQARRKKSSNYKVKQIFSKYPLKIK
jgi:hypothetical protein